MKKILLLSFMFLQVGCAEATKPEATMQVTQFKTLQEAGNCDQSKEGENIYLTDDFEFYKCDANVWRPI